MENGFEPVFSADSELLILGSFPSVKSREIQFYYGNKQNRFWKMLEQVFGEQIGEDTAQKIDFLNRRHIALWDIIKTCNIVGSSDNKITDADVVDLSYLVLHTKIKKIICNGKKAYELYKKHYSKLEISCVVLPSTSPANVSYDISKWAKELL